MRISTQWLRELGIDIPVDQLAAKMTEIGLEVEEVHRFEAIDRVVVGEVRAKAQHPSRDKLTLVDMFDGEGIQKVICGASNVPEPGGRVLFARLGAKIPLEDGILEIAERKLGGEPSCGMICSESELGIGEGGEGIFVFDPQEWGDAMPAPGTPLKEALPVEDVVFEIGLTPNRPDCLGHIGVARDIAAAFGKSFSLPGTSVPSSVASTDSISGSTVSLADASENTSFTEGGWSVEIADADRCPGYGLAFARGVKVGPSPFWLKSRLYRLGVRSISNLVDATNHVMLETGHPIHGFDAATLRGQKVVIRLAKAGEKMTTLDDIERALVTDDLLICDAEGPVALAGVMGGSDSEISESTTDVAIECAYFDPRSVRRTSRRTGLHTDASHRFERGVDPADLQYVLTRSASLIAELGGGVMVSSAILENPKPPVAAKITLESKSSDRLLGLEIDPGRQKELLESIGCTVESTGASLMVTAPTWRPDLTREADLIEEIGRLHGYEHIEARVPRVQPSREGTPKTILFSRSLREAAASAGLNEAITYSFYAPSEHQLFGLEGDPPPLANPLSEERSVMRASLLPGLVRAAAHSLRHQVRGVSLFEYGTIFSASGEALPIEQSRLGLCLVGQGADWIGERDLDFFDLKGILQQLLHTGANLEVEMRFAESAPAMFHPRRVAEVIFGEHKLGFAGELHPDLGDSVGLSRRAQVAELDVRALFEASAAVKKLAQDPPRVPASSRDIALLVPVDLPAATIKSALSTEDLVESVELFDLYTGQGIAEGERSLAFRVTYRGEETLSDKKVDKAHKKVVAAAKKLGATIR